MAATLVSDGAQAAAAPDANGRQPRNIVVFSDGTGQDGGVRPEQRMSNIYKLYRAARVGPENDIDPAEQIVFYDPGLGTDADAIGLTALKRTVVKTLAAVTGRGITMNIADCYEFIINHYLPGDRIYLFGFSRGAYTIRCIANVLMLCGVPTKTPTGELPRFRYAIRRMADEAVLRVYEHGAGRRRDKFDAERHEQARRFRRKYGSGDDLVSNAAPYFIGAFDTVASLGAKGPLRAGLTLLVALALAGIIAVMATALQWLLGITFWKAAGISAVLVLAYAAYRYFRVALKVMWKPPQGGLLTWHIAQWNGTNFDRLLSRYVMFARHALSLDENRADFVRVPWGAKVRNKIEGEPDPFIQLWFAGNHSDIGGSYSEEESRLSDIALAWMVGEVTSMPHPLRLNRSKLNLYPAADGLQHDEVAGMSDTIHQRTPALLHWLTKHWTWKAAVRDPKHDSPVHPFVDARFGFAMVPFQGGEGPYRPEALRNHDRFKHLY